MREVVAEAENPVMLYSIGKDSSVMLHLARKAFYPGAAAVPVPARRHDVEVPGHVPRSATRMAAEHGLDLLVHVNEDGVARGINPFDSGSAVHTDVMKTEGLKQALDKYGFDAAFGGARRDEEKSRAKERVFSFRSAQHRWDPKNQRPELWRLYNARHRQRRVDPRLPALQLDRARRLALHLPRGDPDRAALLRRRAAGRRARRHVDHGRRRAHAARAGRGAGAEDACASARSAATR